MKSPFKFLDPFTLSDRDAFFGRDKEIKELYKLVFKTPLLLIYGLSGTGKTSLIQCGLASQFDGPDWLPLWIRRQTNLNESLAGALKRVLPSAEGEIPNQISQLYRHYLRPVFLIFDQFEELFILGKPEERDQFVNTLKTILDDELPCTILLMMREEYVGQLYPFEKAIPNLFDFRMRVEPMDTANVKTVLRDSFHKFNISIGEPPQEERLDDIIQNVSLGRSGIELPYLQVYLDLLYREDFARTFTDQNVTEGQWPLLEFTQEEIRDFGTITNVLEKFLKEQQERILAQLMKQDPSISESTVKLVLDGFVTDEGTKRPITYVRQDGLRIPDKAQMKYFSALSAPILSSCLKELEAAKILRSDDDNIELAHDSLAHIIDQSRTDEQRQLNNIKVLIRSLLANLSKTNEYLTRRQLVMFENSYPKLNEEEKLFFEKSKQYRDNEEKEALDKEKKRNEELQVALNEAQDAKQVAETERAKANEEKTRAEKSAQKARRFSYAAFASLLIVVIVGYMLYQSRLEKQQSEIERQKTELLNIKLRETAEKNSVSLKEKQISDLLGKAINFKRGGAEVRDQMEICLDSARTIIKNYIKDTQKRDSLLKEIVKIEK
jgi:KaiC/GvpD/RAD55 family RecA-like ATPase